MVYYIIHYSILHYSTVQYTTVYYSRHNHLSNAPNAPDAPDACTRFDAGDYEKRHSLQESTNLTNHFSVLA